MEYEVTIVRPREHRLQLKSPLFIHIGSKYPPYLQPKSEKYNDSSYILTINVHANKLLDFHRQPDVGHPPCYITLNPIISFTNQGWIC